ncbi:hypothetical protein CQY22_013605 [Mycolicibacterium brumae]|uniref:Uncharacterized protein n=1 Tax=Mycolicibacterium brumae TaxID=85968 RepID=A0A2G5P7E8_9MYCO|nr:hypothetical protein CQY22_013605 [Mycolicibacterium brumae]RWA15147.1 hypothetical protein MBRU_11040 [Mycolicibacterium brumae DSM 44177]
MFAMLLGAFGLVAAGTALVVIPNVWAVAAMLLFCVFIVIIGVALWVDAGEKETGTVALLKAGASHTLPVLSAEKIHDEELKLQLWVRLPNDEVAPHRCGDAACRKAARAAPNSELPAIADPAGRAWAVVHGPVDC